MEGKKDIILSKYEINFGKVHQEAKLEDYITVSDIDELDYWYVNCNCTKVKINGNKVQVDFDVKHAIGGKKLKGNETMTADRYIELWFDKDQPQYISNELTKKRENNNLKRSHRIPINFVAKG